jgi:hypothetical protein
MLRISRGKRFRIYDIPGLDDFQCKLAIEKLMSKYKDELLPIFIVDLNQGTANLSHLSLLSDLSKKDPELRVLTVFTKFKSAKGGANMKLVTDEVSNITDEVLYEYLLNETIKSMKKSVQQIFNNVDFVIFDPSAKNIVTDAELTILRELESG